MISSKLERKCVNWILPETETISSVHKESKRSHQNFSFFNVREENVIQTKSVVMMECKLLSLDKLFYYDK